MRRPPSAVSESSSFCLFIKTDGKSWSFRLRRWRILQLTHGNLGRGEAPAVAASWRSIGAIYTPVAVALAILAWAISGEAVRFLVGHGDRYALPFAHRDTGRCH